MESRSTSVISFALSTSGKTLRRRTKQKFSFAFLLDVSTPMSSNFRFRRLLIVQNRIINTCSEQNIRSLSDKQSANANDVVEGVQYVWVQFRLELGSLSRGNTSASHQSRPSPSSASACAPDHRVDDASRANRGLSLNPVYFSMLCVLLCCFRLTVA
jgi:hypothetical protein